MRHLRSFTFLFALLVAMAAPSWATSGTFRPPAFMNMTFDASWYVDQNGGVSNGFLAPGSDTTGNGTKALPYATIDKAQTVGTVGDTVFCNTGIDKENSAAANRLILSKAITVTTDPTALAASGKATLQSNNNTLCFSVTSTSQATLSNFKIDGQSNGVQVGRLDASSNTYLLNNDLINVTGASTTAIATNGTNVICVAEKCTDTAANGNSAGNRPYGMNSAGWSLTFLGGTYDGIFSPFSSGSAVNGTLLKSAPAADGSRVKVNNCTHGFVLQSGAVTQTTVDIEGVDFSNLSNPAIETPSTALTVGSFNMKYCTATSDAQVTLHPSCSIQSGEIAYNTHNKANSFIQTRLPPISNWHIHHNTITQSSSTGEPISVVYGSTGIEIDHNVINSDASTHMIQVGRDGTLNNVFNTAAQATFVKLGDISADTYIAQAWTTPAATTLDQSFMIACARLQFKSIGSPTGTETVSLYSNSGSAPGSSLELSEYTLQDTALTSTPTWVEFWYPAHTTTASATNYWFVIHHTGTPDASNYVDLSANATGLNAHASSTDGSAWTTGVSGSLLYQSRYGSFELVNPLIHDNYANSTLVSAAPHGILLGACYGGKIYNNQLYGTGIGYIAKLVDGSGANTCVIYNNVWYSASTGPNGLGGIVDKGSRSILAYQDTCVNRIPSSSESLIFNDYEGTLTPQLNGQPSLNCTYKNNTFYVNAPSGSGTAVQLGSLLAAQPTCINPTITNNDVFATGSNTVFMQDYRSGVKVTYSTYAAMAAAGWNGGGVGTDPTLFNETAPMQITDFRPSTNLPYGTNLSITISPYNDILGVPYLAASPTVGALNALFRTTTTGRTLTTSRTLTTGRSLTTARTVISSH